MIKKFFSFISVTIFVFSCASFTKCHGEFGFSKEIRLELKKPILKACKSLFETASKSPHVYGTLAGSTTTLLTYLILLELIKDDSESIGPLMKRIEQQPPMSIASMLIANAYGSYLAKTKPNKRIEVAIETALASIILAILQSVLSAAQENISKDVRQFGIKKHTKTSLKQLFPNYIGSLTSFLVTQLGIKK